jgi:Methylamine utilisation protein MauE
MCGLHREACGVVDALGAINGGAASLLIVAAMGKLASPEQPLLALRELLGQHRSVLTTGAVRTLGLVELTAAVGLVVTATSDVAAAVVAVLGGCFVALGIAGLLRRSTVSCGCFGRRTGRPLGLANVAGGAVLSSALLWNTLLRESADHERNALLVAAGGSLAACLWVHRGMIGTLRPWAPVR